MIVTPEGPVADYRHLYEAGVEAAWAARSPTMIAAWKAAVDGVPDRTALLYFGRELTYGELDRAADAFAAWCAVRGLGRGGRLAILLQNVPEFLVATIAAWKLAAIPVPVNPAYRGTELARILVDADPSVVVADRREAASVRAALEEAGSGAITAWTDHGRGEGVPGMPDETFADIVARGGKPARMTVRSEDVGLLMYTSGTTGLPKGAMLTQASLASNARLTACWLDFKRESVALAIAPLFHITGFVSFLCAVIDEGCGVLLPYRMIADTVVPLVRQHRPTHMVGAITAFSAFMNHPGVSQRDFESFERVYSGGAPIAPALREQIAERLGIVIYPGYGMTETAAPTHYAPFGVPVPVDPESGALAIGIPTPGTDAMIAGDDGQPVRAGSPGELLVRGSQIMTGYRGKPEESAEALADGWMHTGDIAIRDEAGWFYIVDRKKDVIIASGFKVWPREVEDMLYRYPAIREAAVIGVPDDYRGETVKAFVSLRAGAIADEADIIAHCREHLAGYKVPRQIEIIADLPKTVTGKIQRNILRETFASDPPEPAV